MPIHDHFDGSANCVECEGACSLSGDARWLTEMVRWLLAGRAHKGAPFLTVLEKGTIDAAGADSLRLITRAHETSRYGVVKP
jgi:hypothetical protein